MFNFLLTYRMVFSNLNPFFQNHQDPGWTIRRSLCHIGGSC